MGWMDSHLHQFEAKGQLYGKPDSESYLPIRDEARTRLDQVLTQPKDSIFYEYDFGDGWTHRIVLEEIIPASPEVKAPRCIAGARACPPEDCGGVFGYAELLQVLKDPPHPEHEDMLERVGGNYDPASLDLEAVNRQLAPRKGRR